MNVEKELREIGVKPARGQNFLISEPVIEALVKAGEVDGEKVLEIGAGTGAITGELAEKAEKVVALETDTRLCEHLQQKFSGSNLRILNQDFLEYEMDGDIDRCVSNLPFQISSEAVQKLGEEQVQSALILQEELADRMTAEPGSGSYSHFTVMTNYYFIPVKLRKVSSRNYCPEPEVDTAIVKLYPNRERHGVEDEEMFFTVSSALFTHARKKVRNAFVDARHILEIEKDRAKELRDELPHSEERVNSLEIIDLKQVAEFLSGRI